MLYVGNGFYENVTVWFIQGYYKSFGNVKAEIIKNIREEPEYLKMSRPEEYKAVIPWENILYIEYTEWPSIQ